MNSKKNDVGNGNGSAMRKLGSEQQQQQRQQQHSEYIQIIQAEYIEDWHKMFHQLVAYKESHKGDTNVPLSEGTLGSWVEQQRRKRKVNNMPLYHIQKLNSICFAWNIGTAEAAAEAEATMRKTTTSNAAALHQQQQANTFFEKWWEENFQKLLDYKNTLGTCNVIPTTVEKWNGLHEWVLMVRKLQNELPTDKKQILHNVGFMWGPGVNNDNDNNNNNNDSIGSRSGINNIQESQQQQQPQKHIKLHPPPLHPPVHSAGSVNHAQESQKQSEQQLHTPALSPLLARPISSTFTTTAASDRLRNGVNSNGNVGSAHPKQRSQQHQLQQQVIRPSPITSLPLQEKSARPIHAPITTRFDSSSVVHANTTNENNIRILTEDDREWNIFLLQLLRYQGKTGHCNVPKHYANNMELASWVWEQRSQKDKLSLDRIAMLDKIGFNFSIVEEEENDMDNCGDTSITTKNTTVTTITCTSSNNPKTKQDKSPGKEIQRSVEKRKIYQSMKLNADREWEQMFDKLKQFKAKFGTCRIPRKIDDSSSTTTESNLLRCWAQEQAISMINFKLSEIRQKRLEAIGFQAQAYVNDAYEETWNDMYEKLVQYFKRHGNCHVPLDYKDDSCLANWVQCQRLDRMKKGSISNDKVQKLDSMGFSWTAIQTAKKAGIAKAYKSSSSSPDKAMPPAKHIKKSTTETEHEQFQPQCLEPQGGTKAFDMTNYITHGRLRNKRWEEMLERLKQFKAVHGHCAVPNGFITVDKTLVNWVQTQRRLRAKDLLIIERRKTLDDLGFIWKAREIQNRYGLLQPDQYLARVAHLLGSDSVPKHPPQIQDMVASATSNATSAATSVAQYPQTNNYSASASISNVHTSQDTNILSNNIINKHVNSGAVASYMMTNNMIATTQYIQREHQLNNLNELDLRKFKKKEIEQPLGLKTFDDTKDGTKQPSPESKNTDTKHDTNKGSRESKGTTIPVCETNQNWPEQDVPCHDQHWNVMFERLKIFKEIHGHCAVPKYFAHIDKALMNWVKTQRRPIKQAKMSAARRKKLDDLGFIWRGRKYAKTPRILQPLQYLARVSKPELNPLFKNTPLGSVSDPETFLQRQDIIEKAIVHATSAAQHPQTNNDSTSAPTSNLQGQCTSQGINNRIQSNKKRNNKTDNAQHQGTNKRIKSNKNTNNKSDAQHQETFLQRQDTIEKAIVQATSAAQHPQTNNDSTSAPTSNLQGQCTSQGINNRIQSNKKRNNKTDNAQHQGTNKRIKSNKNTNNKSDAQHQVINKTSNDNSTNISTNSDAQHQQRVCQFPDPHLLPFPYPNEYQYRHQQQLQYQKHIMEMNRRKHQELEFAQIQQLQLHQQTMQDASSSLPTSTRPTVTPSRVLSAEESVTPRDTTHTPTVTPPTAMEVTSSATSAPERQNANQYHYQQQEQEDSDSSSSEEEDSNDSERQNTNQYHYHQQEEDRDSYCSEGENIKDSEYGELPVEPNTADDWV